MMVFRTTRLIVWAGTLLILLSGCGEKNTTTPPPPGPSTGNIIIDAEPDSLTIFLTSYDEGIHRVEVSINGRYVDSFTWRGRAAYQAVIPEPDLQAGLNKIMVECRSAPDPIRVDALVTGSRNY